jgi:hypothetical protein
MKMDELIGMSFLELAAHGEEVAAGMVAHMEPFTASDIASYCLSQWRRGKYNQRQTHWLYAIIGKRVEQLRAIKTPGYTMTKEEWDLFEESRTRMEDIIRS